MADCYLVLLVLTVCLVYGGFAAVLRMFFGVCVGLKLITFGF